MRHIALIVFVLFLSVTASAQTQDLVLPIALNGYTTVPIHHQTIIRIVNLSPDSADVTLEAYQNDGTAVRIFGLFPIPQQGTKSVFRIESGGSVEAYTAEDTPDLNGWVRLTYNVGATILASAEVALINAPVGPHPICMRPSTEINTSVQVQAVAPATKFGAFVASVTNRKSAYAIINPSTTQTATVFLSLMNLSGQFVGTATLQIPPQNRVSRFVHELVPNVPAGFMGSLHITSSLPVGFGGVNVLAPEGKLTGIQVASPPPAFCALVIAPAVNPLTNECRLFPTPCDIPKGWLSAGSCSQ